MNTISKEPERHEIEALLPWHAAGTLSRRDADRVEHALAGDRELARQYELIREELVETIHLNETLGAPSTRAIERLQRAIALLVQRTLEEHYAFVLAYTHILRDEGWQHTRARFDSVPVILRALVGSLVRGRVKKMLWKQGVLRHSHEDIVESALGDWRAVLTVMSDGPFFFGDEPTGVDAIVFGALATSVLTPIESPIRDFLRSQPACVAYAERMRARFFPDLATAPSRQAAAQAKGSSRAVRVGA
jgi:Glutathione S-transferase, C-terminal domain